MLDHVVAKILDVQTEIECNVEDKEVASEIVSGLDAVIEEATKAQIIELIESSEYDTYSKYRMKDFIKNSIAIY